MVQVVCMDRSCRDSCEVGEGSFLARELEVGINEIFCTLK